MASKKGPPGITTRPTASAIETVHVTDIRAFRENLTLYPRWRAHALATLLDPIGRRALLAFLATEKESDAAFDLREVLRFSFSSKPVRPRSVPDRIRPPFRDWLYHKFVPWQPVATIAADELGVLLWLLVQRLGVEEKAGLQTLTQNTGVSEVRVAGELMALRVFAVYNAIGYMLEVGCSTVVEGWFLTTAEALSGDTSGALGTQQDHDWVQRLLPKVLDARARKTGSPRPKFLDYLTYDPRSLIARFRDYAAGFSYGSRTTEPSVVPDWAGSAVEVFKKGFDGAGDAAMFDTVASVELTACHIQAIELIDEYGICPAVQRVS